jgi:hypothetical protein
MNKHFKCLLKVTSFPFVFVLAFMLTIVQFIVIVLPLGILNICGCITTDIPNPIGGTIFERFHDL